MFRRLAFALLLFPALASVVCAQTKFSKSTWNYDGGLSILTEGGIPSGPCFHLTGRATAPNYFDDLKREDTATGTIIHRGHDIISEYPEKLHLSFLLYDQPCELGLKPTGTRTYLTPAMVSNLRLVFFWKHDMKMRPIQGIAPAHFETRRVPPFASDLAKQLPEKFEWEFEFEVPSAGVPVTDSLVVILRTTDGQIAARAAARM